MAYINGDEVLFSAEVNITEGTESTLDKLTPPTEKELYIYTNMDGTPSLKLATDIFGSLAYELSSDGTYYIVTGRGSVTGSKIVIPDTYQGKPVREIGRNALNHSDIKSITIGGNVVYIEPCFPDTLEELYFTMTAEQCYEYLKSTIYYEDLSYEDFLASSWEWRGYRVACDEHNYGSTFADLVSELASYDGGNCAEQYFELVGTICMEDTEEHPLTVDQIIIQLAG